MRARPLTLLAAEHRAAGEVATCTAALALAEARLADLLAGPTPEEITVAEARLHLAQAQEQALRHQMERLQILAPAGGVVLARLVEPGETVQPGVALLRLGDLTQLRLVLYVPEPRLGEVKLGQQVQVTVDAYPSRTFAGRVQRIADQAEYTPRNMATREERVNTYYAVTVDLPNADGLLKPGMAADATF
jgi:multidrug resistance efflux pump